jgi:exonuclease SbcD
MNDPIRVLHFADLHIGMENYGRIDPATGLNQRVLDFVERLREIVDIALERDADVVIFAGDAFKTRDPNPTYLRAFARQIKRLTSAEITAVLLVGNHDMPLMEMRASSMDIFAVLDVPKVIVGRKEEVQRIATKRGVLQVATVPWPQRSRLAQFDEHRSQSVEELDLELEKVLADEISRLAGELDPALPAILTGHFSVSGATFGSERAVMLGRDTVIKLSALALPAWDYVAMGHIHKHQVINQGEYPSVVYSGSLERIDFGEEHEPKGFVWVEATRGGARWEFVPVAVRPFGSIHVDAIEAGDEPTEAVLREIARHDVRAAVVRVRVKLTQSQELIFRPRDVEAALDEAYLVASIARDVQRDVRSRIGVENPESLTPPELLERYFLSKNMPRERIDELMQAAKDVLKS